MSDDASLSLGRIDRRPRLSDVVSERLFAAIRDAGLPPGSRLPSERELGDQFGVSRTVIREALRDLAARGIIEVHSGSGVTIARIDGSSVSDALLLFLARRGLPDPRKIQEVRETIELRMVRLAAQRATIEHLTEIRRIHERHTEVAGDWEAASEVDIAFHRAIAKATQNELFVALVDSIGAAITDIRRATVWGEGRVQVGIEHHGRILAALERREVEAAAKAMEDHLAESLRAFVSAGGVVEREEDQPPE